MNSLRQQSAERTCGGRLGWRCRRRHPVPLCSVDSFLWRPRMPTTTSSQTIGPFWHLIEHPEWADLTRLGAIGHQITLTGTVIDGDGNPVTDAAVELWQADPPAAGGFPALGRPPPDEAGGCHF